MNSASTSSGRIAAIDFGTVRIGIAITDPQRTIASPLCIYQRRGTEADATYFRQLVEEHQIERFVVGLPVHLDGHESRLSTESRRFGEWLAEVTDVAVEYFDERFTTVEAEALLTDAKLTSKRRKKRRDMLAAQILLSAYLESPSRQTGELKPLDD